VGVVSSYDKPAANRPTKGRLTTARSRSSGYGDPPLCRPSVRRDRAPHPERDAAVAEAATRGCRSNPGRECGLNGVTIRLAPELPPCCLAGRQERGSGSEDGRLTSTSRRSSGCGERPLCCPSVRQRRPTHPARNHHAAEAASSRCRPTSGLVRARNSTCRERADHPIPSSLDGSPESPGLRASVAPGS
jgi:hypothetical protein